MPVGINSSIYSEHCVLDLRFFEGTLRDFSPKGNDGTPEGNIRWSKEGKAHGLYFPRDGSINNVQVGHDDSLNVSPEGTLVSYQPPWYEKWDSYPRIFRKVGSYELVPRANDVFLFWGSVDTEIGVPVSVMQASKSFILSWVNGEKGKFYIDGSFYTESTNPMASGIDTNVLTIGGGHTPSNTSKKQLNGAMIFNRALTADEIAGVYDWTQSAVSKAPVRKYISIPAPAGDKCILHLDGTVEGGKAVDVSGAGNHGALVNVASHKGLVYERGFHFGGTPLNRIELPALSTNKTYTISWWGRTKKLGTDRLLSGLGLTITTYGIGGTLRFHDGTWRVSTVSVHDGLLHHIALVLNDDTGKGQFYVDGKKGGDELDYSGVDLPTGVIGIIHTLSTGFEYKGNIEQFKIYEKAFTPEEVYKEYLKGASVIKYRFNASEYRVSLKDETSGWLSNTPYQILSGTFRIVDDILDGKHVKAVHCIADGELKIDHHITGDGGILFIRRAKEEWSIMKDTAAIKNFNLKAGDKIAYVDHTVSNTELWSGKYFTWICEKVDPQLQIRVASGKPYWINWGDGKFESGVGAGTSLITHNHNYGVVGKHTLTFMVEDPEDLTHFLFNEVELYGRSPELYRYVNLTNISVRENNLEGTLPNLSNNLALEGATFRNNNFTGDIPSLSDNANLMTLNVHTNNLTGYTSSELNLGFTSLRAEGNAFSYEAVNQILLDFTDRADLRPASGTIWIQAGTNAIPDPTILAAAQAALPGWDIRVNS